MSADQPESAHLPRNVRHAIRNELHAVRLGVHLYREQMKRGRLSEADVTFARIEESLSQLDCNEAFHAPQQKQEGARDEV